MLREHLQGRGIDDPRVLEAMAKVPRERFVGDIQRDLAYADRALAIACDQTISQPYIVALMTQSLELTGTEKVLEVGTGSGYQTAILAELAGHVVSIERHAPLASQAADLLAELGYTNLTLITGDGTLGYPPKAPYDRVLVAAAAGECPRALTDQLSDGGTIAIPVGGAEVQILQTIHKRGGKITTVNLSPCRFVPLVGSKDDE